MVRFRKSVAAAVVSVSLMATSTAAVASAPTPPPVSDSWLTLSMLTPGGATLLDSSAAVAAQPAAVTCPDGTMVPTGAPCPAPVAYASPGVPPIPVIIVWAVVIGGAIWLATHHNHGNSPG